METRTMKKVLTIAGSDSGGGAGVQGDLKAITVLGCYGASVLTALTAQNTLGVQAIHPVPVDFIKQQLESVLTDIGADAAKTGMLATPEIVETVAAGIREYGVAPLVVDPVMVAKSGDSLLSEAARRTIKRLLLPLAYVVTPNLPEAAVLSGRPVQSLDDMREAAKRIHDLGPQCVLVKGGHLEARAVDLLYDGSGFQTFDAPRLPQRNTHGTGCTFSAAIASFLAQGRVIYDAVAEAKKFIHRAIASGIAVGAGQGPTNPFAQVLRWQERETVLQDLGAAMDRLAQAAIGRLIPEVRSNLGYALSAALEIEEVAAVPGRISQVGDRLSFCHEPRFGASRHIAKIILTMMSFEPVYRSAMNIRFSPDILSACRRVGLRAASFDRRLEPASAKEVEGSSLEWGTREVLREAEGEVPDIIYDAGEVGKEPMVRVLGKDPWEVVDKVLLIDKEV
jgi:hydroxymethylpyrimidine kinase/phosphomethylpyrimidine kinase